MKISYSLSGRDLWHRVKNVEVLNNSYKLLITFDHDEKRLIDMTRFLAEGTCFEGIWRDPELFKKVYISGRTIEWPDGATLDPDVLYHESVPYKKSP